LAKINGSFQRLGFINIRKRGNTMPGCGKKITQMVPTKYSYKEVPAKCGQTGLYGYPIFCEECEPLYADRDWRREAEENGEQWDDDY
jgi:hypothetical protein